MREAVKLSARAWVAIGFVVAVLAGIAVASGDPFGGILYAAVAFCSGGVAALDSTHVRLHRYQTWLCYGPIGVFLVVSLLWPVAVLWYFVVRMRIARGTMPLRGEYRPGAVNPLRPGQPG